jgi:hypothetical protein
LKRADWASALPATTRGCEIAYPVNAAVQSGPTIGIRFHPNLCLD